MSKRQWSVATCLLAVAGTGVLLAQEQKPAATVESLTQKLWNKTRIEAAMQAVEEQKASGLVSTKGYEQRMKMLLARLAGTFKPTALSAFDPPLNLVQNEGFEQVNRNSNKDRSRWLWWTGWSWGGDYENMWEEQPENVHAGQFSARIRCVGQTGRIGISTPPLPLVSGATEYTLTFWAKGDGDNKLFINYEGGVTGTLQEKMPTGWTEVTVKGTLAEKTTDKTFQVYFYVIGEGTIWLDDVRLVPVGGTLDE
jgi:hypothetical protein